MQHWAAQNNQMGQNQPNQQGDREQAGSRRRNPYGDQPPSGGVQQPRAWRRWNDNQEEVGSVHSCSSLAAAGARMNLGFGGPQQQDVSAQQANMMHAYVL